MKRLTLLLSSLLLFCGVVFADTVTPRTGMTKPSILSPNWGPKLNSNFDIIDSSFAAVDSTNTFTKTQTISDLRVTSITVPSGSAANPSIKVGSTTTGIYSVGTNQINFTIGGTLRFSVSDTAVTSTLPLVLPVGAVGTPSLTFTGDLNTGIYNPGADLIGLVVNGKHVITANTTDVYLYSNGVAKFYLEAASVTSDVKLIAKGTATNDSAASGYIGEYITSAVSAGSPIGAGTSNTFKNITTISLTAGDWDVSGVIGFVLNGSVITRTRGAVSLYSNDTQTDQNQGDNDADAVLPSATYNSEAIVPVWRVSLASTSTVYLKANCSYTGAVPNTFGRISARRVR